MGENFGNLMMQMVYVLGAVLFVLATAKCFVKKMTIPKAIALFVLSPSVSYVIAFFLNIALDSGALDGAGMVESIMFAVRNTVIQLVIQGIFMALYVKLAGAKNSSIAVFVYLCSVMIVPPFLYVVMGRTPIPVMCYMVLNVAFYLFVIKPLSAITGERQTTNMGIFVGLPAFALAFNLVVYMLMMCVYSYSNFTPEKIQDFVDLLKSEGNEALDRFKPVITMALKSLTYEMDMLSYTSVFVTALLIIAFYVIVRNVDYMNRTLKAQEDVKRLSVEVMEALAHTIDAKDEYTRGHSIRVAKYSRMIAEKMGMSKDECDDIYYMGLLHDIGKIGVPNEIINKPSSLTDEEYGMVKKHPATGFDILSEIKTRPELSKGARWHHERYDGTGYPDHKKGEDIPVEARIIAVADSYDAMTSNRSYRGYLPQDKVKEELKKNIGTQFDEIPANCMLEIMDADKDYTLHE